MVFTNDGVVIRSAERYDLVKIKLTESEEEYRNTAYDSVAYDLVRTMKTMLFAVFGIRLYSEGLRTGIVIGWFLRFWLRVRQSSFHWIISVGVISEIGRKWNRFDSSDSDSVELMTPLTTPTSIFTSSEALLRLRL